MHSDLNPWKHGVAQLASAAWSFRVWAPYKKSVQLRLLDPQERVLPMNPQPGGYHQLVLEDVSPGARYFFRVDGRDLPDPASRFQPQGVHGPSQITEANFDWSDSKWRGLPVDQYVFYELHVGTFTAEGTFDAVIPHLDSLVETGITAVEIMPVATFPGNRNWGYDGVSPFAVHAAYGGPAGLKRLVDACHQRGLAVVLDVVYNHLGPEGNYLSAFGPYFTEKYRTPWGSAVNFDDADSDEVRRFFQENALHWVTEFHIDALRLDAIHAIHDESASPFLGELAEAVHHQASALNRQIHVIAESDLNDTRILRPHQQGGFAHDAQWSDDFHHSLWTLLTGDRNGYYQDFGQLQHLATAYREGFVYSGQHSAYRRHRHGNSSRDIPAQQFTVCIQNHDQIGNRMLGDRLTALASFEQLKLAASAVLLSPFLPLLFMGEEYGETAPFLYFVSHTDPDLIEAVRNGRQREFSAFAWQGTPPDPQDESTFLHSKLNHSLKTQEPHSTLLRFYRKLLEMRKSSPALRHLSKTEMEITTFDDEQTLCLRRWHTGEEVLLYLTFSPSPVTLTQPLPRGAWQKWLDSSDPQWRGPGAVAPPSLTAGPPLLLNPHSAVLYRKERGAES
jgi:maltooligosyltrehalose trehalohydrolase